MYSGEFNRTNNDEKFKLLQLCKKKSHNIHTVGLILK